MNISEEMELFERLNKAVNKGIDNHRFLTQFKKSVGRNIEKQQNSIAELNTLNPASDHFINLNEEVMKLDSKIAEIDKLGEFVSAKTASEKEELVTLRTAAIEKKELFANKYGLVSFTNTEVLDKRIALEDKIFDLQKEYDGLNNDTIVSQREIEEKIIFTVEKREALTNELNELTSEYDQLKESVDNRNRIIEEHHAQMGDSMNDLDMDYKALAEDEQKLKVLEEKITGKKELIGKYNDLMYGIKARAFNGYFEISPDLLKSREEIKITDEEKIVDLDSEDKKEQPIVINREGWHSELTDEQILDALSRGIHEPVGIVYEQFLMEHGIGVAIANQQVVTPEGPEVQETIINPEPMIFQEPIVQENIITSEEPVKVEEPVSTNINATSNNTDTKIAEEIEQSYNKLSVADKPEFLSRLRDKALAEKDGKLLAEYQQLFMDFEEEQKNLQNGANKLPENNAFNFNKSRVFIKVKEFLQLANNLKDKLIEKLDKHQLKIKNFSHRYTQEEIEQSLSEENEKEMGMTI